MTRHWNNGPKIKSYIGSHRHLVSVPPVDATNNNLRVVQKFMFGVVPIPNETDTRRLASRRIGVSETLSMWHTETLKNLKP